MVAQISAYGQLVADVQSRTTSNGGNMAFARMAVSLPCQKAENGEMTFWLGVTAFGKQAELLARHKKGDLLSVSGAMQVSQWTGKDGNTYNGYQVVVDAVISARTVKPSGRQGQQGQATNALQRAKEQQQNMRQGWSVYEQPEEPFDDDLPF
ncbi:TPA: single-stranded DNA-binding protein [Yersinia enterocolitica]|uniref:single-stranded DNA-binding protein n=1 Tax=Yersinia enterocolitica TaxID=630 RepID=UPI003D07B115